MIAMIPFLAGTSMASAACKLVTGTAGGLEGILHKLVKHVGLPGRRTMMEK